MPIVIIFCIDSIRDEKRTRLNPLKNGLNWPLLRCGKVFSSTSARNLAKKAGF